MAMHCVFEQMHTLPPRERETERETEGERHTQNKTQTHIYKYTDAENTKDAQDTHTKALGVKHTDIHTHHTRKPRLRAMPCVLKRMRRLLPR